MAVIQSQGEKERFSSEQILAEQLDTNNCYII